MPISLPASLCGLNPEHVFSALRRYAEIWRDLWLRQAFFDDVEWRLPNAAHGEDEYLIVRGSGDGIPLKNLRRGSIEGRIKGFRGIGGVRPPPLIVDWARQVNSLSDPGSAKPLHIGGLASTALCRAGSHTEPREQQTDVSGRPCQSGPASGPAQLTSKSFLDRQIQVRPIGTAPCGDYGGHVQRRLWQHVYSGVHGDFTKNSTFSS